MRLPVAAAPRQVPREAVSRHLGKDSVLSSHLHPFSGSQKISDREAEIAELRATRDAALVDELEVSDSSVNSGTEEGDDGGDRADRARQKAERRRVKAQAKADVAAARLRQLEEAPRAGRGGSVASSEDDDAMWDYMDIDMVLPPRLADLDSPAGR